MKTQFSKSLIVTAVATALVMEAAPVLAQLEEIIVTARKRDETIMKVPVTTTVLGGETLDQYAVGDVKGIADKVPGLNFSGGPLASGVLVSLRGIGTGTNNSAVDQSVALVADGMQFTQGLAFQAATFDLAQVEVLKGPQALFFGKAAPAGVIAARTADPGDEFEARVRLGHEFEGEETLGEVILSGPVTETLGLRLAAQFSDMDGYFKNEAQAASIPGLGSLGAAPVTYSSYPNKETLLLRGTAIWQPSDRLNARLKLNYSDSEVQGTGGEPQLVSCPDGTNSVFNPINFIGGAECKADERNSYLYMDPAFFAGVLNGGAPFNETEQYFGSLELNYDLGNDLQLTSVTGFYDVEQQSLINGSLTTQFGTPFAIQGEMERDDFTQEFRLTSDYAGAVNYMLGAFYHKGEIGYLSRLPANSAYAALGVPLPPALGIAEHDVDTEAKSVFGQVLWQVTPEWEIGFGARWTDEERDHAVDNILPTLFGGPVTPINLGKPEISSSNWSPELSVTYTPSDELTLFGNLKQAYKSGSFDIGGAAADGDDKSFGDERIRGGELGLKAMLLDYALAFNASAYYYTYDDMQVETRVFDPLAGVVGVRTTNAASSELYGIDLDVTYAVPSVPGLTLFGALNWNEAEYDEFGNAACWTGQLFTQGCNIDLNGNGVGNAQDLSGEPLLRAPEWMANFGFDYEMPVLNDKTLRIGSNTNYSSSYSASSTNIPSGYQDSYTKTSASIALIGADNRWMLEVIGDNLTDEFVYGNCAPAGYADTLLFGQGAEWAGTGTVTGGPGGQVENACWVERGRSVWVRLTFNF
ncbi:MAG: TonB-dependent receptor [Gammaproteobacteria bacterium]